MAFNLSIQVAATLQAGSKLQIDEVSNWVDAPYLRDSYGLFLIGEYRLQEDPEAVEIDTYDPLVDSTWLTSSPQNGRYSFAVYAFLKIGVQLPEVDDVQVNTTDGLLYKYDGADWVLVALADVLADAEYTSGILDIPFLGYAYHYKNIINLAYIKTVKRDTDRGAEQNKLYYSRTALDYFTALILAAEYNWSIDLFNNFYQIVIELNAIINSGKVE